MSVIKAEFMTTKRIIKELSIYLGLFLFLALGMHHKAWFDHPIEHIQALPNSDFGVFHPLYFTFGAYLIIGIIRLTIGMVGKLIRKQKQD